jgi:hypothetical protein
MWPWGHLGGAYLLWAGLGRLTTTQQTTAGTWALVLGSQFPDLVDKPLAWSFDLLPNGRSLSHSILIGVGLLALVALCVSYFGRRDVGIGFGVGYLVHLGGDAFYPVINGEMSALRFLFWPVLPPIEYETAQSFVAHFAQLQFGSRFVFESGLLVLATLVWYVDGMPGLPGLGWWERTSDPDPGEPGD